LIGLIILQRTMFKVLISDVMSSVAQKIFEKQKISVDVKTGLSEEEIIKLFLNTTVWLLDQLQK